MLMTPQALKALLNEDVVRVFPFGSNPDFPDDYTLYSVFGSADIKFIEPNELKNRCFSWTKPVNISPSVANEIELLILKTKLSKEQDDSVRLAKEAENEEISLELKLLSDKINNILTKNIDENIKKSLIKTLKTISAYSL